MDYDGQDWIKVTSSRKTNSSINMGSLAEINHADYEKVTFTGDSGAIDHAITRDTAAGFKLTSTPAPRAGLNFRAANGTVIKNFGEKRLRGVAGDDVNFNMTVQVADVKKNLASFVKMVNDDNDIVLSKKGSFIKNVPTGKMIKLNLDKGTPQFDVWVKKASEMGQYGVFNAEGEADIKDSEVSVFGGWKCTFSCAAKFHKAATFQETSSEQRSVNH